MTENHGTTTESIVPWFKYPRFDAASPIAKSYDRMMATEFLLELVRGGMDFARQAKGAMDGLWTDPASLLNGNRVAQAMKFRFEGSQERKRGVDVFVVHGLFQVVANPFELAGDMNEATIVWAPLEVIVHQIEQLVSLILDAFDNPLSGMTGPGRRRDESQCRSHKHRESHSDWKGVHGCAPFADQPR